MNQIDFFGCSFTEAPVTNINFDLGKFDILSYSVHCQNTKPISNFLEHDLNYNFNTEYKVNNCSGGSFGNHIIKEVLKNRIKKLDKNKKNIAIVQLSALLRNEGSFKQLFESENSSLFKYQDGTFDIDKEKVRVDYFVETKNMWDYYNLHIQNLKEIVKLCSENYSHYFIHFGWDVSTPEFILLFKKNKLNNFINIFKYEYQLTGLRYFENHLNYFPSIGGVKGSFGGMLDYSSNKLDESLRYVHKNSDHHPSYFSNKIFYLEVIKPFLSDIISLKNDFFHLEEVINFENFLSKILIEKESVEQDVYIRMQKEINNFLNNLILKNQ